MKKIALLIIAVAIVAPLFTHVNVRAANTGNTLSVPARYYHADRPVYEIGENED